MAFGSLARGDLRTGERRRLHRRTAEALEDPYGEDPGEYLAELAHHFLEAAQEDVGRAEALTREAPGTYHELGMETWAERLRRE